MVKSVTINVVTERTHRVETHEFDSLSVNFELSLIYFLKNEHESN